MLKDVVLAHALWNIRRMAEGMEDLLEKDLKKQARKRLKDALLETELLRRRLIEVEAKHFGRTP